MVERNAFDNDIRSRFEGFAPEPPAGVWPVVQDAVVVPPSRRFAPVFFRVAAAIVFLAIGGMSVWFLSDNSHTSAPLTDNQQQTNTQAADDTQHITTTDLSELRTGQLASAQTTAVPAQASATPITTDVPAKAISQPASSASIPDFASERHYTQYAAMNPIGHTALLAKQERSVSPRQNTPTRMTSETTSLAWNTYHTDNTRQTGQRTHSGLVLGVHMSPQLNDRHIASTSGMPGSSLPVGSFEKQAVSYGYGLSAAIPLTDRLSVQTGLSYKNMNQRISDISAFSRTDNQTFYDAEFAPGLSHPQNIITSFGVIKLGTPELYFSDTHATRVTMTETKFPFEVPDDPKLLMLQGQSLIQSFSFVEMPLLVRYRLLSLGQLDLHIKAGVAGNYLVRNDVLMAYLNNTSERIGQTSGVRELSLSGIGGLSLTWPLTRHLAVFVEPGAQMFLQSFAKDNIQSAQMKTYPYSFSLYSGISFRF